MRDKTTIFISHRLGSTKLAHEIFVLDKGRVAESGSHEELLALGGKYAQMYESQRSWYQ
jgi:ATP-binding cassette subfamily B protein